MPFCKLLQKYPSEAGVHLHRPRWSQSRERLRNDKREKYSFSEEQAIISKSYSCNEPQQGSLSSLCFASIKQ